MDTKHKPRLNRQKKHFERGGFWPRGLLTAYGISSGGRLTGVTKTRGLLTGGGDWPGAIDRLPFLLPHASTLMPASSLGSAVTPLSGRQLVSSAFQDWIHTFSPRKMWHILCSNAVKLLIHKYHWAFKLGPVARSFDVNFRQEVIVRVCGLFAVRHKYSQYSIQRATFLNSTPVPRN